MMKRKQPLPAAVPAVLALLAAAAGLLFACQFQLSQPNQYILCTVSGTGTQNIWRLNWDGTGAFQLTEDDPATPTDERFPIWSHDGNRIYYIVEETFPFFLTNIWVMNADGRMKRQLTDFDETSSLSIYNNENLALSLSPDDRKIAFMASGSIDPADPDPNDREVFTINADGTVLTQLTVNAVDDIKPAWSPDGGNIAFVENTGSDNDICTIDPDGSNFRNLTNSAAIGENNPVWSPDGSKIAYVRNLVGNNAQIWIVSRDGSQNFQLGANIGLNFRKAVWSPDGSRLAYFVDTEAWPLHVRKIDLSEPDEEIPSGVSVWTADWAPCKGVIVFRDSANRLCTVKADGSSPVVDITPSVPGPALTFDYPKCSPR